MLLSDRCDLERRLSSSVLIMIISAKLSVWLMLRPYY